MLNKENKKKFEFQKSNNSNKTKSIKNQLRIKSASNQLNDINLNSSRTKEAIKLLGYSFEEFIFIPFKEYINLHQDVKTLPKQIQRKRYNFSENFRQRKLENIKNLKKQIDINKIPRISNINFTKDNILNEENISSTAIMDNDEWAYRNAFTNCELNGISDIEIVLGDAAAISGSYDVVLANINRNILLRDMHCYVAAMNAGAHIFFSGFYTEDLPSIQTEAERLGLHYCRHLSRNNWVAAEFCK